MEKLQLGQWQIEFDRAATSAAYQNMSFVNENCDCENCKNYFQAAERFPQVVSNFLINFGIDARKPTEIYGCEYKDGSLLYGGFYHLVGNYISGADAWQPVPKKRLFHKNMDHFYQPPAFFEIDKGYKIGFTQNLSLVPNGFPTPVLQMEIDFYVPWVLDTKYKD